MGCLFDTQQSCLQHNKVMQQPNKDDQKTENIQSYSKEEQQLENNIIQMQEEILDLLTDSSLDEKELYQIDESLKKRKVYLMKITDRNNRNRSKSQNNEKQVSEINTKANRRFSQNQISNINNSINQFYYYKFLSVYKVQEKPQQQQKNFNLLDFDQSEQEVEEQNISLENSFSSMKQIFPSCQYCTLEIQEDQFQLECFHQYHTKCLEELIINQIENDKTQIYCVCNQSIKTKLIKSILIMNNEQNCQQLFKRFLENQGKFLESILK